MSPAPFDLKLPAHKTIQAIGQRINSLPHEID
jgi:hypothetical protein